MADLPADFDLKLMPDWLKEPASKNPYADYEGGDDQQRGRGRDSWGGGRPGGGGGDRRGRPGGPGGPGAQRKPGGGGPGGNRDRRDDRGRKDRPAGGPKPVEGKRPETAGGRPDDGRRGGRPGDQQRHPEQRDSHPPVQPANVTIEFFPDEGCAVSIAKQVKSTHRAYSLFDLARMFLARPERHRVKITTKTVAEPLYQVGDDGPVWLDRASAERAAFPMLRQKYYVEVNEQREAPKGNFTNVARCRANGALLGPTNYHGYQPALRRLFEERFSRRMSFPEFQREIEVINDPAAVEQWKQQASNVTVFRIRPPEVAKPVPAKEAETPAAESTAEAPVAEEPLEAAHVAEATESAEAQTAAEPVADESATETPAAETEAADESPANTAPVYEGPVFNSQAEVEQHFRENYLQGAIREASAFHLSGVSSRALTDRSIAASVRIAWEQERGFPGQMMHQLRQHFSRAGLHVFKHRKRMQFVSLIRPSPMEGGSLSPSVGEIIKVVQETHNCTRATLASTILGTDEAAIDPQKKTALATDLRWLIETGRVIEFSDGRLEMPVTPAKQESPAAKPAETPAEGVKVEPQVAEKTNEFEQAAEPVAELAPEGSLQVAEASATSIAEPTPAALGQAVQGTPAAEAETPAGRQAEEAHAT